MEICKICQCNCDPGDLTNGICDDCREEEKRQNDRGEEVSRMLNKECKQARNEEHIDRVFAATI